MKINDELNIQRGHDLFVGEKVFDCEKMLVCEVVEILNNYPNPQVKVSQEKYVEHNKKHFDLECEEDGMEWLTDESSVYQFVPNKTDVRENMPLCYEHNKDVYADEGGYPYYSPYLDENLFNFEVND